MTEWSFIRVLRQLVRAQAYQDVILVVLKARFKRVPRDMPKRLYKIYSEKKLKKLHQLAATCPDLDTFRAALPP